MTGITRPSPILRWSTDDVDEPDRLPYWVEVISDAMFAMTSAPLDPKGFHAAIRVAALDALWVSVSEGSERISGRTAANIARDTSHSFHIMANTEAAWSFTWRGNPIRLNAGDLVFTDTRFVQSARLPSGVINIKLPAAWASTWMLHPERMAGVRIARDRGWGAALSAFVAQLSPKTVAATPLPPRIVADNLGALLALVESDMLALPSTAVAQERRMRDRIRDLVVQRAAEPGLTGADIAASLAVTERTLHRSLAAHGETFGALLMSTRVQLAQRMLEAAHFERITTAEIGRRSGFSDPSHFVRVTARHLGDTPSRYRQRVRAGTAHLVDADESRPA